jgi:hypothetical protein
MEVWVIGCGRRRRAAQGYIVIKKMKCEFLLNSRQIYRVGAARLISRAARQWPELTALSGLLLAPQTLNHAPRALLILHSKKNLFFL